LLEEVRVEIDAENEGFETVVYKPCPLIKCNGSGITYTSVTLPNDFSVVTGTLACTMKYKIKDCDSGTGQSDDDQHGYPDESVV